MMGELIGLGSALSLGISGLVLKPLSTKFSPFFLNALLCAATCGYPDTQRAGMAEGGYARVSQT